MEVKQCYREASAHEGECIHIDGWIRQSRISKNVGFLMVNDGTFFKPLQVVITPSLENYEQVTHIPNGSSIAVDGILKVTPNSPQPVELEAKKVELLGSNAEDYPIQNKRQSMEFLRQFPYLRSRTNTFQAVFRTRSEIAYAIHEFFHSHGFTYVHTPIITASDAEGAGEMFQVTTLDLNDVPRTEEGKVNYKEDFFATPAHLTVSGQLELESFAMSHRNVYTFGPAFRAEHSNTTRHAAEFWMIEPEIAFADLTDMMDLAEAMMKHILNAVMERLPEEMEFFNRFIDKGLKERLDLVRKANFARMTYTEAIEILSKVNDRFEFPVKWGCDLQSEHERYLTEEIVRGPLFVTDYPKEIKSFYMRLNDDGKTVACADMLVPGIGELIGGSQREEREDVLLQQMKDKGIAEKDYQWYTDLRRFGGCVHSGYGLGFERCVMYVTGMENIRDVVPYPRTVKSLR